MTNSTSMFEDYRRQLLAAGIKTVDPEAVICPLCWGEKQWAALSLEHVIPKAVGGRSTILTCRQCNNDHGRTLDSHLVQFQSTMEAIEGNGLLKATMDVNGHKLSANFDWSDKNFHIVHQATNPAASAASKDDFRSGNVSSFKAILHFGYNENRFRTALIRAAYLVLFQTFGYQYAIDKTVQIIRRRIMDPTLEYPDLSCLTLGIKDFIPPGNDQQYVVPAQINGVPFFMVFVRVQLRRGSKKFLGACLPHPGPNSEYIFDLLRQHSKSQAGETFHIEGKCIQKSGD